MKENNIAINTAVFGVENNLMTKEKADGQFNYLENYNNKARKT